VRRISRHLNLLLLMLLAMATSFALLAPVAVAVKAPPAPMGTQAYTYIDALTRITNPDGTYTTILRKQGTVGEVDAAAKVQAWFTDAGYLAQLQPFTYEVDGTTYSSQNVVASRPAAAKRGSKPRPLVIIGAHYDARTEGAGADDNASGVAVMLEVAQRIAKYKTPYDLVFVAFGAEESPAGEEGSAHYVAQMSKRDTKRAIVMINYDSLIVGDKLYVHAGFNKKTWARDRMLRLIKQYRLHIRTQPGWNPEYPAGLTPNGFSDYSSFNKAGIPIVSFESTNWEIADLDGYTQTELHGSFWHTPNDTLAAIESLFPYRPMVRLYAFTKLTYEFLQGLRR